MEFTKNFEKLFLNKKKSGNVHVVEKIKKVIGELSVAIDPGAVGEKKKGASAFWSCRLNDSSRLIYDFKKVNERTVIRILRVCDHRQAYGHD